MKLKIFLKKQKALKKRKGLTLIELIVVITILTILGTIAFISFTGYSKSSRDSKRIADIGSIQKSLEIYITEKGTYPIPDDNASITYSGTTAWIEGTVGDGVIMNIKNISKKPIDPLTGNEYTYSITASKTEYQIGAISESGQIGYKLPINQTHASSKKQAKAMIKGNYNARFLRIQSGLLNWILAMPSIIVSDITETDIQTILNKKKLVHNNYSNIPHSYNNYGYTMTGGFEYTNPNPLIYSGSMKALLENENKVIFITNLKQAYSGTILHGDPEYIGIANLDTEFDQTKAINLVNNYINSKVGGIGVVGIQDIPMEKLKCGVAYRVANGVCVESIAEGQICTGLPANAVWNSTNNITQRRDGSAWLPSTIGTYNTESSTEECRFKCKTNYTWNSTTGTCNADTKSAQSCTGIPTNSTYNTVTNITQTRNGTARSPSTTSTYNTTTSTTECRFKCNTNYTWNSTTGTCNADTKSAQACIGKPTNSVYNTATSITQTRNGSVRTPTTSSTYNTTASTTECRYKCNLGYTYQNGQCNFISPTCAVGYTYNTVRDKCEITPVCASGYTYNTTRDMCEVAPPCASGYTYNTSTKLCQKVETISATVTVNTAASCCNDYCGSVTGPGTVTSNYYTRSTTGAKYYFKATWDASGNLTYGEMRYTMGTTTKYNHYTLPSILTPGTTKTFTTSSIYMKNTTTTASSCPSGYTLSGTNCTRTLTATPICSSGGALNTTVNLCQLTPTCSYSGILNGSVDKCQLSSTCSTGVLNISLDACVEN